MSSTIYTIGYATKPINIFIEQLKKYAINIVIDVRSVPFSKAFSDYHQHHIKQHLNNHQIKYVDFGELLGPRSKDSQHYNEHYQVQFDRLMQSAKFNQGIERLKNGLTKGFNIALMCAEKDPSHCHRSLLIGYYLIRHSDINIAHILHNGQIESEQNLEQRLMHDNAIIPDMFSSHTDCLQRAYNIQKEKMAYIKPVDNH
ncbi:DUF488 family protein [Aliikangiella maris]|uniref:DUF488 domain-containing protein n=2 Tax=Aliikangiella maris TaxID=3162458 RepID=A0ABV2C0A0_9GAMM